MNTGDIFETRPPSATPGQDPTPAPAKNSRQDRPFASVMDQALNQKSAHTRTTKSSATDRRDGAEEEASPPRAKVVKFTKPASGRSKHSETADEGVSEARPGSETTTPAKRGRKSAEEPAATVLESEKVSPIPPSQEEASDTQIPANIIPFPATPPAPSVIVPFPIAAAKAAPAVADTEAAPAENGSGEAAAAGSPASADKILKVSSALFRKEPENAKGVDVAALGLKPVEDPKPLKMLPPEDSTEPSGSVPETASPESSRIIPVTFAAAAPKQASTAATTREPANPVTQSQLPGEAVLSEDSTRFDATAPAPASSPEPPAKAEKAPVHAGLPLQSPSAKPAAENTGTTAARQEIRMESLMHSDRDGAANGRRVESVEEASASPLPEPRRASSGEFQSNHSVPADWERPGSTEPSVTDVSPRPAPAVESTATVERISRLVQVEAALVKKHNSDSMAVVLRPDAETELFVHFTQRDGRVEATVRCERGDAHQLGALWPQLQESLAQHKIRLAPLQESPAGSEHPHTSFNQPPGSGTGGGNHPSPRQNSRGESEQFMDEWPVPASSTSGHVRGRGGSRHRRVTTSRPGWETWA